MGVVAGGVTLLAGVSGPAGGVGTFRVLLNLAVSRASITGELAIITGTGGAGVTGIVAGAGEAGAARETALCYFFLNYSSIHFSRSPITSLSFISFYAI